MIDFDLSTNYKGEGISEGFERGVLVFFDGKNLVQEGMGLGSVALRTRNLTYFSKTSRLRKISENEYIKEFYVDSIMTWKLFNKRSIFLTKLLEEFGKFYKTKNDPTQDLLLNIGVWFHKIFGIKSEMTKYRYLGKVVFKYSILENEVIITADFSQILKDHPENMRFVCILNELGGDYFDSSRIGNYLRPAPSGWNKIKDSSALRKIKLCSKDLKLEFGLEVLHSSPNFKIDYFYGRENVANYCWAGFGMEIDLNSVNCNYEDCVIEYVCKFDFEEEGTLRKVFGANEARGNLM